MTQINAFNDVCLLCCLQDDFLLRHYDKGPCKNKERNAFGMICVCC